MAGVLFTIQAKDEFSKTFDNLKGKLGEVKTETNKTGEATDKAKVSFKNFDGSASSLTSSLGSMIPIAGAVAGGVAVLAKTVTDCVKSYMEAEVAQVRFSNAMRIAGVPPEVQNSFFRFATTMQNLTGISDEVIQSTMSMGLTYGIEAEHIQKATEVALDLSSALGIDLSSAMRMLAKGTEGNIVALTRFLPELKNFNLEAMDTAEILELVGGKVEGTAAAMGGTLQGSMSKLKESFGDLKETIGSIFAPAVKAAADQITNLIQKANEFFQIFKKETMTVNVGGEVLDLSTAIKRVGKQSGIVFVEGEKLAAKTALEILELQKKWGLSFEQAKQVFQQMKFTSEQEAVKFVQNQQKKLGTSGNADTSKTTTPSKPIVIEVTEEMKKMAAAVNEARQKIANAIIPVEQVVSETKKATNAVEQIEEPMVEYAECIDETSEIIQQYKEHLKEIQSEEEDGQEIIEQTFDGLGLVSSLFNVDLKNGIEGFLISLLTQTQTFQMLGQVIQPILAMLDALLGPLLLMFAPILNDVIDLIGIIIRIITPPVVFLAVMINNMIESIKALGQVIFYIVTFQWGKISSITPNMISLAGANQIIQSVYGSINQVAEVGYTPQATTAGAGVGATYTAAPTFYISVYVQTAALVGDSGMDEFAMLIKQKIELAMSRGT